jgi:hypothetical protein
MTLEPDEKLGNSPQRSHNHFEAGSARSQGGSTSYLLVSRERSGVDTPSQARSRIVNAVACKEAHAAEAKSGWIVNDLICRAELTAIGWTRVPQGFVTPPNREQARRPQPTPNRLELQNTATKFARISRGEFAELSALPKCLIYYFLEVDVNADHLAVRKSINGHCSQQIPGEFDMEYFQEMQRRVRAVKNTVAHQLPVVTVGVADELINANECGVALEIMSEMLVESNAAISRQVADEIESLCNVMGLDPKTVERLKPLIQ